MITETCNKLITNVDEWEKTLSVVYDIYIRCERLVDALRIAIKLDDRSLIETCFRVSMDPVVTKQLA